MKKPAVFLDRDGVITTEKSYVLKLNDLEIFPYAEEAVRVIHEKGYWAIVITNQSAVGRGMLQEDELKRMNDLLIQSTGVDAVFYCPHWSANGTICSCRKPQTGLIEQAMKQFEIDSDNSYFVGDRASDIECGQNMGIRTVMLESGYGSNRLEKVIVPDYSYADLKEFAEKQLI